MRMLYRRNALGHIVPFPLQQVSRIGPLASRSWELHRRSLSAPSSGSSKTVLLWCNCESLENLTAHARFRPSDTNVVSHQQVGKSKAILFSELLSKCRVGARGIYNPVYGPTRPFHRLPLFEVVGPNQVKTRASITRRNQVSGCDFPRTLTYVQILLVFGIRSWRNQEFAAVDNDDQWCQGGGTLNSFDGRSLVSHADGVFNVVLFPQRLGRER